MLLTDIDDKNDLFLKLQKKINKNHLLQSFPNRVIRAPCKGFARLREPPLCFI